MVTLALKIIGLLLAWKSGLKVSFLPLGPSCSLQILLLSDLGGGDSPLQIVIAVLLTFFCSTSNNHYCQQWAPTPDPASSNSKKCVKLSLLSAEGFQTRLNWHHCHLRTYYSFFSRLEKPSEDTVSRLFFINMKGLRVQKHASELKSDLWGVSTV